jgi:endoglucanase
MSLVVIAGAALLGCSGGWAEPAPEREEPGAVGRCEPWQPPVDENGVPETLPDHPRGFRVAGNRIEDADGQAVFLRGVNRSGTEYRCVQGAGFFDGPNDDASILAIKSWGLNAVRVPLNETCWLALNDTPSRYAGECYRNAILDYVWRLHRHGLVPILELHWAAPGERIADALTPMPNADHSPDFWRSVASTFLADDGVIFEPFNEPFPDRNRDTAAAWSCWRDGCVVAEYSGATYAAAGMQSLVDAIRETGAGHLVLLGGVEYSNALTGWLAHKPNDPLENLGAAWHAYNFNRCNDGACWDGVPAALSAEVPVVATEIGQDDCEGDVFLGPLMQFLDQHGAGYLAWAWNAHGACRPSNSRGAPWSLITSYAAPEPNSNYARTFYEHVQGAVR